MKKEGKRIGIMPPDKESATEDKMPGDSKEDKKLKHSGKTKGKSNKLGGGGRFQQLVNQGKSPALAAWIGRRKYGAKKMASMAAKGKK